MSRADDARSRLQALKGKVGDFEKQVKQVEADLLHRPRQLTALQATVEQLQKQLAAALKNSSNSSKPPSSDIVKPPKPQPPPGQERRQPGGQPGHPAHQRELFPPEMLASTPTDYLLDAGGVVLSNATTHVVAE
jgi:hypothetical protein